MIISAVNTNKIPKVSFRGGSLTPEQLAECAERLKQSPIVNYTAETDHGLVTRSVNSGNRNKVMDLLKSERYADPPAYMPQYILERGAREHHLGTETIKTVEVIKEVPASSAQAAAKTATEIPWKKYGPIAAIAAVAVGVTAFFIGKAAEKKRQEKLNDESDVATTNRQPQPVLQEIAKKPDTSIENFFSAPQATAKT